MSATLADNSPLKTATDSEVVEICVCNQGCWGWFFFSPGAPIVCPHCPSPLPLLLHELSDEYEIPIDLELTRCAYMVLPYEDGLAQAAVCGSAALNRLRQEANQQRAHGLPDEESLNFLWSQMEESIRDTRCESQLLDVAEILSRMKLSSEQGKTAGRDEQGKDPAQNVQVDEADELANEMDIMQLDDDMVELKNAMHEAWNEMESDE